MNFPLYFWVHNLYSTTQNHYDTTMWFTCFIVPPLLSTELLREDEHEQDLGSVQGRAPTHHR